nr:hypothetical protein [Ardenticatena sp.]
MLRIEDHCQPPWHPHWVRICTGTGEIVPIPEGCRLRVLPGDNQRYHLAELDDTHMRPRHAYLWRPPVRMRVQARFSSPNTMRGTAGFGFWNMAVSTSANTVDLTAPHVFWIFLASPPNQLALTPGWSGHGFFVQSIRSPVLPRWVERLGVLALRLPFVARRAYHAAQAIVPAAERPLEHIDPTTWHTYQLEWDPTRVRCMVDGQQVLDAPIAPRAPLGFVAWVDNQFAVVDNTLRGGWLAVEDEQFLDLREIVIEER